MTDQKQELPGVEVLREKIRDAIEDAFSYRMVGCWPDFKRETDAVMKVLASLQPGAVLAETHTKTPPDERAEFMAWRDSYCATHGIGSRWDEMWDCWLARATLERKL